MLTQEDKINVEVIKKIMVQKKTTFLSLWNQDWEKVKVETGGVKKLLINIPTNNITELNELIYARAKLTSDKINVPQRKPNKNIKLG